MGVTPYRAFISRCANLFMKCFFPIKGIREYSCGFRAYRAEKIIEAINFYGNDFIQLKGLGFTCTLEKLIKLKITGARFAEVRQARTCCSAALPRSASRPSSPAV